MPTFSAEEKLRLSRLAVELNTYGEVQYAERRRAEAQFELLKVRYFVGEYTDTQYWLHHTALVQLGLRQYARFHDGTWRMERYDGERIIDKLRAATEDFEIDAGDVQPANGQAEL